MIYILIVLCTLYEKDVKVIIGLLFWKGKTSFFIPIGWYDNMIYTYCIVYIVWERCERYNSFFWKDKISFFPPIFYMIIWSENWWCVSAHHYRSASLPTSLGLDTNVTFSKYFKEILIFVWISLFKIHPWPGYKRNIFFLFQIILFKGHLSLWSKSWSIMKCDDDDILWCNADMAWTQKGYWKSGKRRKQSDILWRVPWRLS